MSVTATAAVYAENTTTNDEMREYIVHYQITTDSRSDGPAIVRAALPAFGTSYSYGNDSDANAFVVGYSGIRPKAVDDTLKLWMADVRYSTVKRQNCSTSQSDSPLDKPPHIRTSGLRKTKPVNQDINGNKILNSAKRPFDDLEVDDSAIALLITINQASVDIIQLDEFTDSVNSSTFYGLGPRKWKMEPASVELNYYGNCDIYYTVNYEFHSNTEEWTLKPLDAGRQNINGKLPSDELNTAFGGVVPLDGAGAFLAANADPKFFDGAAGGAGDPFKVYEEKDFGLLGIPTYLP